MSFKGVEFFGAVILVSRDARRLAWFYREVLGMPLKEEKHDGTETHFGCELGDLHFAIHPIENFPEKADAPKHGVGSVRMAFEVFDMEAFVKRLEDQGVAPLYSPREMGPMLVTAVRDPDGNEVEFTQLASSWFRHLEKRREEGHDIIRRWKARQN